MTLTKDAVASALHADRSWETGDFGPGEARPSGWNSDHPFLVEAVREYDTPVIVEVGVWKGGSTIAMATELRSAGMDGVVVSVDTFLGSAEHYANPDWRPELRLAGGRPRILEDFLANVLSAGLADYVLPLALDSVNAAHLFGQVGLRPHVVHIDAGHDLESVTVDLDLWFSVLAPGGTIVCDDYTSVWPDVVWAVDTFTLRHPVTDFRAQPNKCRFRKALDVLPQPTQEAGSAVDGCAEQLAAALEQRADLSHQLALREREIADMRRSRSWRWTGPLRRIAR